MQQGRWQEEIHAALADLLKGPAGLAAFDFDNTLIHNDLGEACLYRIILEGLVHAEEEQFWQEIKPPWVSLEERQELQRRWLSCRKRGRHPAASAAASQPTALEASPAMRASAAMRADYRRFSHLLIDLYLRLCRIDLEWAYRWSRHIFAWQQESDMRLLSRQVMEQELGSPLRRETLETGAGIERGIRIHPELRSLIAALLERDWEVKIVTASPHFLIEPLAHYWDLQESDVVGMELEREGDLLLAQILEPLPCFEGKVSALKRHTAQKPALAVGNSLSDIQLLTYADRAIYLAQEADRATDQAKRAGLLVQRAFI